VSALPLAQQELLEPPPRRRLIVPAGHSAWFGVDPSSKRVSIAAVLRLPDGSYDRWVRSVPFVPGDGGQRLHSAYHATRGLALEMVGLAKPGVIWVEQPSGRNVNHPLEYAVGVILAAVFDAAYSLTGVPVVVETVPSASWKKLAVGRGDCWKPTRAKLGRAPEFEDYAVAAWSRRLGYRGYSWDESDALGVAEAARREIALIVR
jgi:hypothetical protein